MKAETKTKIKDWFIITRIRVLNFIKEHKYASATVGLLLFTIFIAIIVKATDDDNYIKETSVSTTGEGRGIIVKTESDDNNNKVAPNFSEVIYTISYSLGNNSDVCSKEYSGSKKVDQVVIEATIPYNSNLRWNTADVTTFSDVIDEKNEQGEIVNKTLKILIPEVDVCSSHTQSFSLSVLNAVKGTSIKPSISITGGSAGSKSKVSVDEITTSYDDNKVYQLTPKVVSGVAKKISDTERDARFGLLLGIEGSSNKLDLKNSRIETKIDVALLATQGINDEVLTIYSENTNNKNYFGVNDSSKRLFPNLVLPDLLETSGNIIGLSKMNSQDAIYGRVDTESIAPVLTLTGDNNVELEKYPEESNVTYRDSGLDDAKVTSTSKVTTITEKIYKDGQSLDSNDINLKDIGTYKIHYKIEESGNSTEIIKTVKIVEPQSSNYSIIGPKTIYIKTGDSYVEKGLYSSSSNAVAIKNTDYTVKYKKVSDNTEELKDAIDTTAEGNYKAIYDLGNNITIERNIIVGSLPSITSDKISVQTSNIYNNETNSNHKFKKASNEVECNSKNNCVYKLDDNKNSETYTITTDNYITLIKKPLNIVPLQYKLSIENISPYFELNAIDNSNFFAIGSYYVTAKSTRVNDEAVNVKLKARIDSKESEAVLTNKANDSGFDKTTLINDLYVNELGENVKVDSSTKEGLTGNYYTAAMGEEITLKSDFEYSYEADDPIRELTINIPVDKNLIPIAYNSNITEKSSFFYLEATYEGQEIDVIPDYDVEYYSNNTKINPGDFDSENIENTTVIDNIIIKLRPSSDNKFEIKPGTILSIKTKYKVRSFKSTSLEAKDLNDLKFNLNPTFSWVGSDGKSYTKESGFVTPFVYITPYKVRAEVGIGFNENYNKSNKITLDASKNEIYTVYAPTSVIAPTMNVNSEYFGYSRIKSIPVIFELPLGINYVYNSKYENVPSITYQEDKTILTYEYSNVEPNTWLEPIYFDFNVDVSTNTGDLEIKTYVGNLSNDDFSINNDQSSINKYKTITNNIHISNEQKVSYGQYIYSNGKYASNINKNDSFEVSTKLHNNTNSIISNATVYTVLPYQDTEKDSLFNGTYEVENIPANAVCTSDPASKVTNGNLVSEIIWQPCSDFKNSSDHYSGFTAYKVSYGDLAAYGNLETKIKVNTFGNHAGDKYVIKSFLTYLESDYISFRNASVEVVDKELTGTVWEDFNFDGVMDNDELKISAVSLKLYNSSDELLQTTTPDENGKYIFRGLSEGNYYVVAEFNTDKYGLTNSPSNNFYDKSRLSVFKAIETTDNSLPSSDDELEAPTIVRTDLLSVEKETRVIRNINLGLSLKRKFKINVNKYITRAEVTNALGVVTKYDYGNTKLAKLDVKNINNLHIKVIYTIELENVKYYPGYITRVTEQIPDGMSFNSEYSENKGWEMSEDGILYNRTLENELIKENEKKYLTVAFDITRKEAGSFINYASVDEVKILGGEEDEN